MEIANSREVKCMILKLPGDFTVKRALDKNHGVCYKLKVEQSFWNI